MIDINERPPRSIKMSFVHLHTHTEHSYLDGVMQLHQLVGKVKETGMPAIAMTDHGGMHGAVRFYKTCMKAGVKPIIGCELYVTPDVAVKDRNLIYHLTVLAKDYEGYKNLMLLTSFGYNNLHYKPRVDYDFLRKHSKGLIGMSACLGGEIPQVLLRGIGGESGSYIEEATRKAVFYNELFNGDFYLELQRNGFKEQDVVNPELRQISAQTGIKLVPTNDCHYLEEEDWRLHGYISRIVKDGDHEGQDRGELWVRTPEEMAELFEPELIQETLNIADQCNLELSFDNHVFPLYETHDGLTPEEEITKFAFDGLKKRGFENNPEYIKRLEEELEQIISNGFSTYLLIVADFIREARSRGIAVGPGRGSAAGSLVCYCLEITDLDPLPYNLLFERFINPERVSLPDIDVDFCERRRPEIIQYMVDKYGQESVAQIANINSMQARMAIKDIARAMSTPAPDGTPSQEAIPIPDANRLSSLIPKVEPKLEKGETVLSKSIDLGLFDEELKLPLHKKLLDYALKVEGMARGLGVHAAGIVVADTKITDYAPTFLDKEGKVITQFDKKDVESVGLVKIDFLGLKNMTLIQTTIQNIKKSGKDDIDIRTIPLDDEKTFELYCEGDVDGIFQMESAGMRKYLGMLQPKIFEDIIALVALYRPGPLTSGMVDDFVGRKRGREETSYFGLDEMLEDILKPTCGVIVYQEQVMQLAQAVAGFTLGQADILRRAMGKKDPVEMAAQKGIFVEGAVANGVNQLKAEKLFEIVNGFAGYGFNKSHSAAYALISYQTAYLKSHYPMEFMTALMEVEKGDHEKLGSYIKECRKKYEVSAPDILLSGKNFTLGDNQILFGLSGIKGIPDKALDDLEILQKKWKKEGKPDSISLLLAESPNFSKKFLEVMNKAGAFDGYEPNRALVNKNIDAIASYAKWMRDNKNKIQKKHAGQLSLFEDSGLQEPKFSPEAATRNSLGLPDSPDQEKWMIEKTLPWKLDQQLANEREVLGFYVSGAHPIETYLSPDNIKDRLSIRVARETESSKDKYKMLVVMEDIRNLSTKKDGRPFVTGEISDETGSMRFMCWPNDYERITRSTIGNDGESNYDGKQFVKGQCFMITGNLMDDDYNWDGEGEAPKQFVISSIANLSCDMPESKFHQIEVGANNMSDEAIEDMHQVFKKHSTVEVNKAATIIMVKAIDGKRVPETMKEFAYVVDYDPSFMKSLSEWRMKHESAPAKRISQKRKVIGGRPESSKTGSAPRM